ncbi:hypothetical protein BDQ12DRAFT_669420 [Crucibulum laeve]|uniref:Uncharacterized protein n=1 Tax=Crucibulum laeve TaxID=68775 RepID=A0A5C3LQB4_9AGAR|nr:hypothetical protein BDQ12DRAFT_669420 [Crucibulum laeve]
MAQALSATVTSTGCIVTQYVYAFLHSPLRHGQTEKCFREMLRDIRAPEKVTQFKVLHGTLGIIHFQRVYCGLFEMNRIGRGGVEQPIRDLPSLLKDLLITNMTKHNDMLQEFVLLQSMILATRSKLCKKATQNYAFHASQNQLSAGVTLRTIILNIDEVNIRDFLSQENNGR